jgi:hypothetical protein
VQCGIDFILDSVKYTIELYKVMLYLKITTESLTFSEFLLRSQHILNLWSSSRNENKWTYDTKNSILVTWKEIQPIDRQQTPAVQVHNNNYKDIWH